MPRFFTRKKPMDTQAEPKINETETNQSVEPDKVDDTQVEPEDKNIILYKGQDIKKLKAEDPGNDLVRRYEEEYGEIL